MSQSKSSPQNTTANTSTVSTTNNNVSGNSGVTLANNGTGNSSTLNLQTITNTKNISTDPAVVASALSAATTAFGNSASVASDAISANQSIDQASIDQATGIAKASLALVSKTTESANAQNINSLDTINTLASGFATQLQGVVTSEQEALQQDQASSQVQLGNIVSALSTSFVQGSQSASTQVVNAAAAAGQQETQVIKYIAIAVGLVAVVYFYRKAA